MTRGDLGEIARQEGAWVILDAPACSHLDDLPVSDCINLFDNGEAQVSIDMAPRLAKFDLRMFDWLQYSAWTAYWGVILETRCDAAQVRELARRLFVATGTNNTRQFIRYHDPRVFQSMMQVLLDGQIARMFEAVEAWIVRTEDPDRLIRFALAADEQSSGALMTPSRSIEFNSTRYGPQPLLLSNAQTNSLQERCPGLRLGEPERA